MCIYIQSRAHERERERDLTFPSDLRFNRGNVTNSSRGFTLLELLLVIAMLAILAVVVIMVLNPVQMLAESRDVQRQTDLATIKQALVIAETSISNFDPDGPNYANSCSGEASQKLFVSVPSDNGETSPTPPPAWTIQRVTAANAGKVDGTGWLPVALSAVSGGSPLSTLPSDPTNTFASGYYYTYTCSRTPKFALTAKLEAAKNQYTQPNSPMTKDGGISDALFEIGSNLSLTPAFADASLVAFWKMDETSWTNDCATLTVQDSSQYNNDAKSCPATTGPTGGATGKIGNGGSFGTTGGYVDFPSSSSVNIINNITVELWIKRTGSDTGYAQLISKDNNAGTSRVWGLHEVFGSFTPYMIARIGNTEYSAVSPNALPLNTWRYITGVRNGTQLLLYENGVQVASTSVPSGPMEANDTGTFRINLAAGEMAGIWDEVRVYNRALSTAEIGAHYYATQ